MHKICLWVYDKIPVLLILKEKLLEMNLSTDNSVYNTKCITEVLDVSKHLVILTLSGELGSVEYTFITITPRSTQHLKW